MQFVLTDSTITDPLKLAFPTVEDFIKNFRLDPYIFEETCAVINSENFKFYIWPIILAVIGYYIVHELAIRRQFRTEILEVVSQAKLLINEVSELAIECWRMRPSEVSFSHKHVSLTDKMHSLGVLLTDLADREPKVNILKEMARFRKICSSNIEDNSMSLDDRNAKVGEVNKIRINFYRQLTKNFIKRFGPYKNPSSNH
jgi:hypothetical protein